MLKGSCLDASIPMPRQASEKPSEVLGALVIRMKGVRSLMADSQYSREKIRQEVDEAVIHFPTNQKRGVEGFLRVDRRFRAHGPEDQRRR